jgi:DNA polymerase alpha subunit B
VVLLPSPADAFLDAVFPQWPIDKELFNPDLPGYFDHVRVGRDAATGRDVDEAPDFLAFSARITVLPNPATFVLGDLAWGASSVDALFQLSAEEASRAPPGERPDRVAAMAAHCLEQRSYYPLYPAAPPEAPGGGVPLEIPQLWHTTMPCAPDVLVMPSRLGRPCVRVLGGTVLVQPGALARNRTFARVAVFPRARTAARPGEPGFEPFVPNHAPARVRVDIQKISVDED